MTAKTNHTGLTNTLKYKSMQYNLESCHYFNPYLTQVHISCWEHKRVLFGSIHWFISTFTLSYLTQYVYLHFTWLTYVCLNVQLTWQICSQWIHIVNHYFEWLSYFNPYYLKAYIFEAITWVKFSINIVPALDQKKKLKSKYTNSNQKIYVNIING